MPYATSDDLLAKFGLAQLLLIADRDNDGELDAAVLAAAIASGGSIVDLAVRGRYALPLSPVDQVVTDIVCDFARTHLFGQSTDVPEIVSTRDKAARDLLKQIADGTLLLSAAPAAIDDGPSPGNTVESAGDDPVFTSDSLQGF